jgi:hypothetical protein
MKSRAGADVAGHESRDPDAACFSEAACESVEAQVANSVGLATSEWL